MKKRYPALIIDLDGCIYLKDVPIEGSDKAVNLLIEKGVKFLFLTNNSIYTSEDFCKKLKGFGIPCTPELILTSGEATAKYILSLSGPSRILPVTGGGFKEYARRMGHTLLPLEKWRKADYVVVGLDRQLTYEKLQAAVRAIYNGARFVATNTDRTLPTPEGPDVGAGAIVKAIEVVTEVKPIVIGKPSRIIMDIALSILKLDSRDVLVVGDRVETDIKAGKGVGADTALVLTGTTRPEDVEKIPDKDKPTYVARDLYSLVKMLYD